MEASPATPEFLDIFSALDDPRSQRNRLYTMAEILLGALCATICGAEGWQDVEDFCKAKLEYLRQILPYKNGSPSDDTFRRFFRALDPHKFQELFRHWVSRLQPVLEGCVIAIDGKASRHSFDEGQDMLHTVSAFLTEERLVLAQEKVADKSNEIKAVPQLLEWLDLKGSTVTIDAMGCQHAIANKILSKEGNYILALKGNQGNLNDDVRDYFDDESLLSSLKVHEDYDKGHGRIELRQCWVEHDIDWLRRSHPAWHSIKSIVRIDATRKTKKAITRETRYYVSSTTDNSEKMLRKIRSHWAIENNLHWVLDMSFGDDQSRIRRNNAPQVMTIIRHVALNLLQLQKRLMNRQSIKRLRKMAGWDHDLLSSILVQNSGSASCGANGQCQL